jgi:putative selenium metabolism protein SsnA
MSLILANATLASFIPRMVRHGHIAVEDGRIESITDELPAEAGQVVDCSGRVVMPGNVCAHTHLYSTLARGMPAPKKTPRNFPEILEYIWWKLDRALDEHGIECSAAVGALDAARCGTTTLIDHHASPNFIDGSLSLLAGVISKVGLRSVLCYEVTDRGGKERRVAGLRENERFLRENASPLAAGVVGAHASFTLENETLEELAGLAQRYRTGVHIHVAEDQCDEDDSSRRCGMRAALRLAQAGLLQPKSIAAHGVHLDPDEIETVQSRRIWLVHNCRSNMNNSVGRAPVLAFGERCALGTDGIDQDMFSEARTAYFRGREDTINTGADRFVDLLAGGGVLASEFFPYAIGNLEVGSAADLIVLDYDPPTPLTQENLAWHWMFAMTPRHVESVMVQGNWVIYRRDFRTIDEERIRADARGEAMRIWERMDAL